MLEEKEKVVAVEEGLTRASASPPPSVVAVEGLSHCFEKKNESSNLSSSAPVLGVRESSPISVAKWYRSDVWRSPTNESSSVTI